MTSQDHDKLLDMIVEQKDLIELIEKSRNSCLKCDTNMTSIHEECLSPSGKDSTKMAQCPNALMYILIVVIAIRPKLIEEDVKKAVVDYYQRHTIKAKGFFNLNSLRILTEKSKTPALTWLKYESLLTYLIRENIYEPKTVADELLTLVKNEIPENIASKFASVMESCAKFCRDKQSVEEQEEGKWCEIIDWLSWFIGSTE